MKGNIIGLANEYHLYALFAFLCVLHVKFIFLYFHHSNTIR